MTTTIRITLRTRANRDGLHPLEMRLTKDRKHSYVSLGVALRKEDWDADRQRVKKNYPNSTRLNAFLQKKLTEASDHSLDVELTKGDVSVKAVRDKIKPASGTTFFAQADLYVQSLKSEGKYNQYHNTKARLERFKKFLKSDIPFPNITQHLLERFKAFVKTEHGCCERTAVNHLVAVRSVFSQAMKAGLVEQKHYPFGKGKVKIKFPDAHKIGLTAEEVGRIETAELSDKANHARNLWLFSFYFAGMRVSDVLRLRWDDFQEGRLYYSMGKNYKGASLAVPDKALKILEQYRSQQPDNSGLVFPDLKEENFADTFALNKSIATKNSSINHYLKEHVAPVAAITKPLTMHIARHTFGNLAGDKIPIQMLQKLYRHSSITTTIGYQASFIHKDADDALDAVIGF
jgi:integrase